MRKRGSYERFLFALAEHLHKSVAEIRRLPVAELAGWQAYFSLSKKK